MKRIRAKYGCHLLRKGATIARGDWVINTVAVKPEWEPAQGLIGQDNRVSYPLWYACRPISVEQLRRRRHPSLTAITKFMIMVQDSGHLGLNIEATKFLKKHRLSGVGSLHQRLTRNPNSAYQNQN